MVVPKCNNKTPSLTAKKELESVHPEYKLNPQTCHINYKQIISYHTVSDSSSFAAVKEKNKSEKATEANWITGFVDAEGCFIIGISENKRYKLGWTVKLSFTICLHARDEALLHKIKIYFGVGSITKSSSYKIQLQIQSIKDLGKIIEHFDKFSLITKKREDYELWKKVFYLIKNEEHLQEEGLNQIVGIKAYQNRGLSLKLKSAFPNLINLPILKGNVLKSLALEEEGLIKDPNWLAGFTAGDGCFSIIIAKSESRVKPKIELVFKLTQHSRDELLMRSLVKYFDGGKISKNGEAFDFKVTKFLDIKNKIIPFFQKYPILGIKSKDFKNFCRVAELMENKFHLTEEGLNQIYTIKAGCSTGTK